MVRKTRDDVRDDEELEMLLDERRHRHVHGGSDDHGSFVTLTINGMYGEDGDDPFTQKTCPCVSSPVSGFSLQSDGSSSSLFSGGNPSSDNGSQTPPPLEELKSSMPFGVSNYQNSYWLDSTMLDSTARKKASDSFVDELGLCDSLSRINIRNQYENSYHFKDTSIGINGLPFRDNSSLGGNNQINAYKRGDYDDVRREFSDCVGVQSPFPRNPKSLDAERNSALFGLPQDYKMANVFGSPPCSRQSDTTHCQLNGFSGPDYSPWHSRQLINNHWYRENLASQRSASLTGHQLSVSLLSAKAQQSGMNLMEERGLSRLPNSSLSTNLRPYLGVQNLLHYSLPMSNARAVPPSHTRIRQCGLEAITSEGSFILQGEGLNYFTNKGSDRSRGQNKGAGREPAFFNPLQRSEVLNPHQVLQSYRNPQSANIGCSFPLIPEYNSLAEAQGYIYLLAKDQHGCRFLQRVFDEGTPQDVQVIFNEIIGHVVELMMNPFGNYLMQKLLDVCNEEQRTQILLMITEEPGQLVRISLNTHGTRVVQKLIETLKTRQQISLAVSVLEPGFLALIKDLNGNHVVQRCLQCLGKEDNTFIFVAAAKYCVDIATHQHGCCVLQRCIAHSSGEHREKLVAEVSANALLLAQNQYGNYVVQFILELKIPSATASIISQFEGKYVHLSTQKFSSHVVEKCLAVFNDEHRSRVIRELLYAPHFEQLLQDPHANYVVQSALRHSEGHVHNILVEKIESYKAVSRNSPYSKKIFSQKLLKK
ncbi:putative pumilio-like protein 7, chloroplastic [Senna tora]|uniref:Putative pumilio-like protein 7, chloroplastic n=1 Tax=Senna tora TaxID=362788 RepID=A0A834SFX8_9FABA|nr:putative pumilio-like protein 7, chloroplastic [Senna tora]